MWMKKKRVKYYPIGVDLGSSSLKMAQINISGNNLELLAAKSAEIPHEHYNNPKERLSIQSKKIHHMLKSGGFKGHRAIISLPSAFTSIRQVKIPLSVSNNIDNAVRAELNGQLSYPVEDAVIRHYLVGKVYSNGEEMQTRFVVAASQGEVNACIKMAHHAGLEVVGVDIEACAIVECFARLLGQNAGESRTTLIIDIGWTGTQVALSHGQKLAFARNLPVGGQNLDQTVAETLNIPIVQACRIRRKMLEDRNNSEAENDLFRLLDAKIVEISGEIIKCLRYHESIFTHRTIERVIFVGGQAHNSRLCESIAKRLNLPAQVGDPMAGIKWPHQGQLDPQLDRQKPNPSWAVAIGLSLSADLAPMKTIADDTKTQALAGVVN
ncbi:MAG: pilus assembly protein PilM [Planctomycetota bacterium]|nr:pilus assembly protein PilM [Planctomycetota bacterium]